MHYYQFNIGDYRRRTIHLTPLEHGIYRLLLDTYYLEEGPLTSDHANLMRTHSVRSAEEQAALENVLTDFFILQDDGYHHAHCDEQIAKYQEKSEKAAASAKARWSKTKKNAKAMRTHSEGNANHKPITNNQSSRGKKFSPPTFQEVKAYCDERGNKVSPNRFLNFYESKGWMVGKNKMKDWKAAVRNWEQRDNDRQTNHAGPGQSRAGKVADKLKAIAAEAEHSENLD